MSIPPNPPPPPPGGGMYYTQPPQPPKSNSSGCWKIGGITCGVLLLLMILGGIGLYNVAKKEFGGKGGIFSTAMKVGMSAKDGLEIQKAIIAYHQKNGKYPDSLTALVPDYLPNGKILHNDVDPVSQSPGHISWKYYKPSEEEPGNTALLALPYELTMPGQDKSYVQKGQLIITLDGKTASSHEPPGYSVPPSGHY